MVWWYGQAGDKTRRVTQNFGCNYVIIVCMNCHEGDSIFKDEKK